MTRLASFEIDCHFSSTYVFKETELGVDIGWLEKSVHGRKESVSVIEHK